MARYATLLAVIALAAAMGACGGSPAPTPPPPLPKPSAVPPKPPQTAAATQPASPAAGGAKAAAPQPLTPKIEVPAPPSTTYDRKGRRDPFETLETRPGQGSGPTVAATRLTGIVRGIETLALVETSDGLGYILKLGDTLADGRLLEIGADSVTFAVAPKAGSTTNRVVLRLATN